MILLDANLLLYAYNPRSKDHDKARQWLEDSLSGMQPVRLAWLSLWAFLRISTNPRVFERPFSVEEASAIVQSWLARPETVVLEPGERHHEILQRLLIDAQATGPLVMDAALAAIAIEHGATLCTTDRDFSRFDGLSWKNPLRP
jgi:toxin-antitoxin system PIN domain toxin